MLKRTVFFWLTSFGAATAGYGLLWLLLAHRVFGAIYKMLLYQDEHPLAFIGLACLCFGPLAAGAGRAFARSDQQGRAGITLVVTLLTVVFSSPLGGMLWYWYDMQAGYFPADWGRILLVEGSQQGLTTGWLVVVLSIPYSWLGLPVCYHLLRAGERLFPARPSGPLVPPGPSPR